MNTPRQNKVVWLTSWYPSKINKGLGDFIQRQAVCASMFNNIKLYCLVGDPNIKSIKRIEKNPSKSFTEILYYYPSPNSWVIGFLFKFYYLIRLSIKIFKEIDHFKPDLIHVYVGYPIIFVANIFCKILHINYVFSDQSTIYYRLNIRSIRNFIFLFEKKLISNAKAIIVASEDMKRILKKHNIRGNYFMVQNPLENISSNLIKSTLSKPENFQWLHTSTLATGHKNVEGILETIVRIKKERQDIHCTFIGGTPQISEKYRLMAGTMGLTDMVTFIPEINRNELLSKIQTYDAFVMFSNFETFGISLMEALKVGLPSVASKTGVAPILINNDSGVLVDIGDKDQLYLAMMFIMNHYEKFNLNIVQAQIQLEYSEEGVGKEITNIYNHVLKI